MNSLDRLDVLERNLTRAFKRYHADAQIRRVVGVFFSVLTVQLLTGFRDWTWKGLLAVLAAAGYGTLRAVFPTVPWSTVLDHIHLQQQAGRQQTVPPGSDGTSATG